MLYQPLRGMGGLLLGVLFVRVTRARLITCATHLSVQLTWQVIPGRSNRAARQVSVSCGLSVRYVIRT